jgi:hypothetical protein
VSVFTDSDRLRELVNIRAAFVDAYTQRRIDHREGDCTDEQIHAWENQAFEIWRRDHPALSELFPSHLPDEVTP